MAGECECIEHFIQLRIAPACNCIHFYWRWRKLRRLPDTIYYQIDGGSENTAKCVIAMCELLVARRLTKKIVLTRLLVGHTHEDIDSKFGVLWKHIRSKHVHSPQEYKIHIEAALSLPNLDCRVVDIIAIPD